jgi:hypothetical protein
MSCLTYILGISETFVIFAEFLFWGNFLDLGDLRFQIIYFLGIIIVRMDCIDEYSHFILIFSLYDL